MGGALDRMEFRVGTVRQVGFEPDRHQAGERGPAGLSMSGVKRDETVRAATVCSGLFWFLWWLGFRWDGFRIEVLDITDLPHIVWETHSGVG